MLIPLFFNPHKDILKIQLNLYMIYSLIIEL